MIARKAAMAVSAAALLSLGGCISLFPKSEPAQLYRFGQSSAAPSSVFTRKSLGWRRG